MMVILNKSPQITFCSIVHVCFCIAFDVDNTAIKSLNDTLQSTNNGTDSRNFTIQNTNYTTLSTEVKSDPPDSTTKIQDFISTTEAEDVDEEETEEVWFEVALRDIAYYLRNFKFNEWDRRYYKNKPDAQLIGFHDQFPSPNLKSIHWAVEKHCSKEFFRCIAYLHNIIKTAPFTRNDDIVTSLNKHSITINFTSLRTQNNNCKRALLYTDKTGLPFDGPQEKFIWRTSAAYYMCWYTMKEHPALTMLGESCDNYANCLDTKFGNRNHDPRSNDMLSFACAMYSFCPDPCCSLKHVTTLSDCYYDGVDPCYNEHSQIKSRCSFERRYNQNFEKITENKWNISCHCSQNGFRWDPQYGMCVDINECNTNIHRCNRATEDCINDVGSYQCVCKWGYQYNYVAKTCVLQQNDGIEQFHEYRNSRNGFDLDMRDKFDTFMDIF